jgi:CheY-like chemotaxis protein
VLASVEHARALVERMVSITGKGKMHLREVDLGGMVQGVFRIWKASAPQHLQSDVRTTDPPVMVRADPTQLSRVIWNLLQNASDALAGPLGKIEVTVSVEAIDPSVTQFRGQELVGGDYGVLSIADDGAGMSPSDREQMCDPFFTTKEEGRGLGLSAVLGIVQGHHGALQVESEVGRGTRMRVFLPLAPQDGANAEGSLVLVVDDEEPIRRVARKALSKHGYRVCLAGSGGEGLRVFESRRDEICVVLLDMTMPDLQGAEVLRRIRESGSQVPVLLCSGFDRQAFQSSECEDPRVAFIEKPYGARNLIDRIEHLLAAAP